MPLNSAVVYVSLAAYLTTEVLFYFIFRLYLIPRANQRTEPHPYRDYGRNRRALLLRILARIEETSKDTNRNVRDVICNFLLQWFQEMKTQDLCPASSASDTSSIAGSEIESEEEASNHSRDKNDEIWTVPGLRKGDMDEFFGWAFFGAACVDLADWQRDELARMYVEIEQRQGLVFPPGTSERYIPRRLTLENVDPLHRPLLVYISVILLKVIAGLYLKSLGFHRHVVSRSGLVGWHRAAREGCEKLLPILFFHGIAPGGLIFYLPMVLAGLANDGRTVFLFENRSISCSLNFSALNEEQTLEGVDEIVTRYLPTGAPVSLVGHSFGSCQLTWLLHDPSFRNRVRQFILMDPVTILLSEPDVMINFIYRKEMNKIRMLASSELVTEYYLRRHFAWYNSELWLEDVPEQVKVLIALSEHDEIVNSPKVKEQLDLFTRRHPRVAKTLDVIYWKHVGHAHCVTSLSKWKEIKNVMLQQELSIAQH